MASMVNIFLKLVSKMSTIVQNLLKQYSILILDVINNSIVVYFIIKFKFFAQKFVTFFSSV